MEDERFTCESCGKVIEFERPLFCPYCGTQVDPTQGLTEEGQEVRVYEFSRVAPNLLYVFLGYLALSVPILYFFGRRGFTWLSILFAFVFSFLLLGSMLISKQKK